MNHTQPKDIGKKSGEAAYHEENQHINKPQAEGPDVMETGKAVGKGVVPEYLRTELKSVENRGLAFGAGRAQTHGPVPTNTGAPTQTQTDNRAVMTRNPLYM